MPTDSDPELRTGYTDLLGGASDQRRLRLLRHLDAGYRTVRHGTVDLPRPTSPRGTDGVVRPGERIAGRRHESGLSVLRPRSGRAAWYRGVPALSLLAVGLCVTLALAASSIVNLGKPTNNQPANQYFPLSGFHRVRAALPGSGKPELLWIGTSFWGDAASDAERWPVVKALQQFGTLRDVSIAPQVCISYTASNPSPPYKGLVTFHPCTLPTFDWSRAQYHSPYISFVHKDLVDSQGRLFQHLSAPEARLFDRYVREQSGDTARAVSASIFDPNASTIPATPGRVFPLLVIGRYVETVSAAPLEGDFGTPRYTGVPSTRITHHLPFAMYMQTLTFNQARGALSTGTPPQIAGFAGQPPPSFSGLIPDVNGEANVIIALICHADGGKPGTVCGRPVIKQLLRHVK